MDANLRIKNCLQHGLHYEDVCPACLQGFQSIPVQRDPGGEKSRHPVHIVEAGGDPFISLVKPRLPSDAQARKNAPMARGLLDYFPKALADVAEASRIGNEQHHSDKPLHWDRAKSPDEADCIVRHLVDRGTIDTDGVRHSAKVAWRALAMLERELDGEKV